MCIHTYASMYMCEYVYTQDRSSVHLHLYAHRAFFKFLVTIELKFGIEIDLQKIKLFTLTTQATCNQPSQVGSTPNRHPTYIHTTNYENQVWPNFQSFFHQAALCLCVCVWNAVRAFAFNFHHIAFVQFFVVGTFAIVVAMLAVLKWHIRGILFRAFALDATSIKLKSL